MSVTTTSRLAGKNNQTFCLLVWTMLNIVGYHITDHLKDDAPLTSDIEKLAQPMSHWSAVSLMLTKFEIEQKLH